eukprot:GFUD01109507.1.p1 GENE.GFUD01109507.1~~GFUD01109507.1.p1  ORF type:complete len:737 (+),score=115.03 GFUD01109507.1:241-2451(+)
MDLFPIREIKNEMEIDDYEQECEKSTEEYEDYRNIVIEIDEKILKFISSFKIGSILSLEVLVALADKFECEKCSALFYSKKLFEDHKDTHSSENPDYIDGLHSTEIINLKEDSLENGIKVDNDTQETAGVYGADTAESDEEEETIKTEIEYDINQEAESKEQKLPLPFICNLCDKAFLRQSWLVRHCFSHQKLNQERYSCFHCKNVYESKTAKDSYRKHIDRLITREERICEICGHIAKTVDFLDTHKQVKHFGLKQFKCDECDKEFSKNRYLIIHRRTHNTTNTYKCDQCDYSSNLQKNTNRHKARNHVDPLIINLNCEKCEYVATNKERLQTHVRSYHSGILHECIHCEKKYKERSKYLLHLRRDHQGLRYKCENCAQEFTNKHTLVTHVQRDHQGFKIKCEQCEHESTSQRALRFHILKTHGKNPFACDVCAFVASNYPFLYSHKNKMHNGIRYHCDLCEHVSYNDTLLKSHMKMKHPDQDPTVYEHQKTVFNVEDYPKCEPCNKLFLKRKIYIAHNLKKHNTSFGKSIIEVSENIVTSENKKEKKTTFELGQEPQEFCSTCEKKFKSKKRLDRHIFLNHSSTLQCAECGKSFTDKKVFINHQKWHRYDKVTSCEDCGKQMTRSSLLKHIKVHHSDNPPEKKNVCDVCGKAFYIPSQLMIHMKQHNNEKDFVCTFEGCDMAFYTKSHRVDHERVHTGRSIKQCDTCTKEFKSMSAYRYHIKRIHPPMNDTGML